MTDHSTNRRQVLRGGALGLGALVAGAGLAEAPADAATTTPQDVALTANSTATTRFWLTVAGVKGPSTIKGHEGQIPVLSFGWGITNSVTIPVGGGSGVGKPAFSGLTVAAASSLASPPILLLVASGRRIASVTLTGERQSGDLGWKPYLSIVLSDAFATSLKQSADGTDPVDALSLTGSKVKLTVDGVSAGWDFSKNAQL